MRAKHRSVDDFLTRLSECKQMTSEITAIDGGHIFRVERAQIARRIPVIEMTTKTLQAIQGVERGFEPFDNRQGAKPAKIMGGNSREEIESDVRRGRAVSHNRCGLFLKIVRRKHVVFWPHESLEKAPRPARSQSQRTCIIRRKWVLPRLWVVAS